MTDEDDDSETESSGGMADHLQRYKNYVNNLKHGKSSGISAAFGRATDLLPPELFEVKPPSIKKSDLAGDDLQDSIGTHVRMPDGITTVTEVFAEGDQRMFMLANGQVLDERAFNILSVKKEAESQSSETQNLAGAAPALSDEDRELIEELEETLRDLEIDPPADGASEDHLDSYVATADEHMHAAGETSLEFDHSNWDDGWPQLSVNTAFGAPLWNIYYDGADVRAILMSDGSTIRRAEGRPDFILALKPDSGSAFKFFILDGVIVDPSTGNIYIEANQGAYSAAFLNNGWIIHQYRTHDGNETYFASAPASSDEQRETSQVLNLSLDVTTGAVTYDALDGSASTTLKSHIL